MAKNKEVFEYQAKINVDTGEVVKKLETVKDGLMNLGGDIRLPKHFISDLSEAAGKMRELQKSAPGSGASNKELKKYTSEMQKLITKVSVFSDELKNISFSDNQIKKAFQELQKLQDMINTAEDFNKKDFEVRKSKISPSVFAEGFKEDLENARKKALQAAELGYKGATPKSTFKQVKTDINAEILKEKEKGNTERVKELQLAKENIDLLEAEISALRRTQENRLRRVESLNTQLAQGTAEKRAMVETNFQQATAPLQDVPDQLEHTVALTDAQAAAQREVEESARAFDSAAMKIKNLFSATTVFYTLRRVVQGAIRDFQELDKQFNEIAIVSDYSTQEMWKSFASVNKTAQEFGVTTKNVLEVQNLYYHQGKDMAEVNKLTAQTLTLAKITGMDYSQATSDLTAALNAYNIAAEDAVRITDTIAAMDTNAAISSEELMTALTKTASIAANAGMSLETTEIFLTKMIETTREAPENLGTALKTIIARFGEVKQEIDGEEIELADINKVDTALKSIGISLLDTAGQIRNLDDVFMELSAKWDDLDRNTQRYIATQAAGSRQQSRFIAMMEDYDRTLELTNIMQTSAGIGASQLAKSMESLESSLNRLKSTWQETYSKVISSNWPKVALDGANAFLKAINSLPGPTGAIVTAIGAYVIKTQVLDRVLTRLAVTHDVVTGKIQDQSVAQAYSKRLEAKRENSILRQITANIAFSESLEETNKEILEQVLVKELLANENYKNISFSDDLIVAMLTEKGMSEKLAKSYVAQTIALQKLNKTKKDGKTYFSAEDLQRMAGLSFGDLNNGQNLSPSQLFFGNAKYSNMKAKDAFKISKNGAIGGLSKSLSGIGSQIAGIAGSVAGVLPYILAIAAVIAIIVGTIYVIYKNWAKNNEVVKDNTKSLEELNKQAEEYNKQLEKSRKLKSNVDEYKELQEITVKTTEQLEREQEISKEIADEFPILLDYIDEEGNYRLKNIEHLDEEIKKQKQLTLEAGETNAELQRSLALKGIVSADDTQVQGINTRLQGLIQELELTDKDTKTQAATISKKITGQRGYGTHQGNEIIQGFLDGTKSSISMGDLNEIFGATDLFTEDNIDDFFEAAKGKDLSDIDVLRDVFSTAGIEISKADTSRFYKYLDYIPEIGAFITEQWGKVESANKTAITNALSLEDFNFEMSAKDMAKFGEIFAGAETQDAVNYFKNMSEDEYNSFIDEYLNLEDKKIGELDEILTTNLTGIEKIIAEYRNKQRNILIEKRDKLISAGLSVEFLNELTSEQVAMMSSQFSELASKTNEGYAKIAFQELFASAEETFGKDAEKFNDFINVINSADLSSPEGVEAFQKKLYELGYSTDDVYKITLKLAGGIKNLPLRDAASQIESINKELEETEKVAKSISALLKGEGSFEDIALIATEMANAKMGAKEILAFYQSIQMTMNGFKMSQESLNKYADVYLGTQKKIAINAIQGYMTSKANLEAEKDRATKAGDTAKIKELDLKIEEATAQIEVERIKWYSIQLELKKQMIEATLELMDAELAATQKFADSLANLDRFAGLNTILERLSGLEDSYEFNVEFSMNADVIADNWEKQIDNINNQLAVNQAGRAAALDEQQKWQEVIATNGLEDYVSFKDGAAIVDQNKLAKLYEERYNAEIALANGTGSKYEVEKYDTIINLIEKSATGYNNAAKAYEDYTKGAQDNAKKLVEINKQVLEAQSKAMEEFKRVTIEAEDAHLEAVKEKYDKMKEEDQKYLDSVRRMIDKERELRDRENNLKNIKDKEKKLAMMKMDTSGVYAGQIRELEDELAQDYQDFEDSEIDRAINEEEERFRRNAELWDKETEYIENVYEERRKTNQYYWDLYEETAKEGTDAVVDYMTNKSIEYQAKDEANQVLTRQQWTQTVAAAQAAGSLIQKSQDEVVIPAINRAQQSAEDFDDAIQEYADSVTTSEEPMRTTISNLAEEYKTLATRVNGVAGAYQKVIDKFDSLILKAETLLGILQDIDDIDIEEINNTTPSATKTGYQSLEGTNYVGYDKDGFSVISSSERTAYYEYQTSDGQKFWSPKSSGASTNDKGVKFSQPGINQVSYTMQKDGTYTGLEGYRAENAYTEQDIKDKIFYIGNNAYLPSNIYDDNYILSGTKDDNTANLIESYDGAKREYIYTVPLSPYYELFDENGKKVNGFKFAEGGYVDYTGPAWVDGTKSHPEYMLNATQTAQFESLVDALSMVYEAPKLSNQSTANSQKTGDSHMEFHINVEGGISSDYDVDKAVERIEKKILDSGKYRNTTVIKKSN